MPEPRMLSEEAFTAIRNRVIDTAPDGLDEAAFNALLDRELAIAESAGPVALPGEHESPSLASPAVFGGLKAAPGIVATVHATAKGAGKAATAASKARVFGVKAPGIIALEAARRFVGGDTSGAAQAAAGGAALHALPKAAAAVQRATAPTSGVTPGGARWALKPGMGGSVTRLGGLLSRIAGPVGLAVETVFGEGAAGHRPYGETAETTAARQEQFARDYKALVNAKQPGTITGETVEEVLESIRKYQGR